MNIGIVGAGIMGRLMAWFALQQAKQNKHTCHITLFDKDGKHRGDAAAYTAAGMICPYAELETCEDVIFSLGSHALTLWPKIADKLPIDIGFRKRGNLVVAHTHDINEWHFFNKTVKHKLEATSLPINQNHFQAINQAQLQLCEPDLKSSFQQALHLPQDACVDSQKTMQALQMALEQSALSWHENTLIEHVAPGKVITKEQRYTFDTVIDCRGLGAKADQHMLRGVRGEVVHLFAPEVTIKHMIRLMHPRYQLYLVPQMQQHHYLIGATQIESDDRSPVTVRSALELLSCAYSLHSGFAEAHILELRQNCRPAYPDNIPHIHSQEGLLSINGLYRHGYLIAPSLAEIVAQYLFPCEKNKSSPFLHLIKHVVNAA